MNARSYLFVPADRPQRFTKALGSGADAVIVDLEDAVAPVDKDAARDTLAQWLTDPGGEASVVVRVNGTDSPWFDADLALVLGSPRVAAVMLPKADGSSPWHLLAGKPVVALVETATGIEALDAVARAQPVRRLAFGSVDLQLDLGIDGDDEALLFFRSRVVLASRLGGLPPPVEGVCTSLDDAPAIAAHAQRARRFGFGGQLCIHPAQVAPVNAAFAPTAAQVEWARRVIAAADATGGAAVAVDGKMVDRPVLMRARALLLSAGQA